MLPSTGVRLLLHKAQCIHALAVPATGEDLLHGGGRRVLRAAVPPCIVHDPAQFDDPLRSSRECPPQVLIVADRGRSVQEQLAGFVTKKLCRRGIALRFQASRLAGKTTRRFAKMKLDIANFQPFDLLAQKDNQQQRGTARRQPGTAGAIRSYEGGHAARRESRGAKHSDRGLAHVRQRPTLINAGFPSAACGRLYHTFIFSAGSDLLPGIHPIPHESVSFGRRITGQSWRRTVTTLPRIVALRPEIGSKFGLHGISQTSSPARTNVLMVASPSTMAATISPFSAVGC